MTRFYLIRHGATEAPSNILVGRSSGVGLSNQGRKQVIELAGHLSGIRFDAMFVSPLERTMDTASHLAQLSKKQPEPLDDLLEVDFGDWTGRSYEELQRLPEWPVFNLQRTIVHIPNGETYLQVQTRSVQAIEKFRRAYPEGSVAIVSHGDVIRAIICYYLSISLDHISRFEVDLASYSLLEIAESHCRLLSLNSRP